MDGFSVHPFQPIPPFFLTCVPISAFSTTLEYGNFSLLRQQYNEGTIYQCYLSHHQKETILTRYVLSRKVINLLFFSVSINLRLFLYFLQIGYRYVVKLFFVSRNFNCYCILVQDEIMYSMPGLFNKYHMGQELHLTNPTLKE